MEGAASFCVVYDRVLEMERLSQGERGVSSVVLLSTLLSFFLTRSDRNRGSPLESTEDCLVGKEYMENNLFFLFLFLYLCVC